MNFEILYLIFAALITASLGLSCLDWPANLVCSLWDLRFLWVAVSYVAGGYGHARFLFQLFAILMTLLNLIYV